MTSAVRRTNPAEQRKRGLDADAEPSIEPSRDGPARRPRVSRRKCRPGRISLPISARSFRCVPLHVASQTLEADPCLHATPNPPRPRDGADRALPSSVLCRLMRHAPAVRVIDPSTTTVRPSPRSPNDHAVASRIRCASSDAPNRRIGGTPFTLWSAAVRPILRMRIAVPPPPPSPSRRPSHMAPAVLRSATSPPQRLPSSRQPEMARPPRSR